MLRGNLYHGKSISAAEYESQKIRGREFCMRSLSHNQGVQRWNDEQELITRAECHHHVGRRVLGDANTCPLRALRLQVKHSLHVILLPMRCMPVHPRRDAT